MAKNSKQMIVIHFLSCILISFFVLSFMFGLNKKQCICLAMIQHFQSYELSPNKFFHPFVFSCVSNYSCLVD